MLVVDDVEMNRDVLAARLRTLGYDDITMAANGQEALDLIQARSFDLVLLDVMMPVMNGYQVLERLRAEGRLADLPVVMVSAATELDSVVRCIEMGAEDYLPKPINATLLRARLSATLEKKRLRDQIRADRDRLAQDLVAARELQLSMVPADLVDPAPERPVTVHAQLLPARSVGGDLCDFFTVGPRTLCVAVGDVSGKGAPAALFMARTLGALRAVSVRAVESGGPVDPGAVMAAVNVELTANNQAMVFTTLFLGLLDLDTGVLAFSTAGHDLPYLIGGPEPGSLGPAARSLPLGVSEDAVYRGAERALRSGEGVLAFTDGVTEAMGPGGEQYGEARLRAVLAGLPPGDGSTVVSAVLADVAAFVAGAEQSDDITLLALRWLGGGEGKDSA